MARIFGTVSCSIWDDDEFCALGSGAQRTYLMLFTQADIAACGVLPLTLRRWARTCGDKDLNEWLDELVDARFVLIDEDTEELFVRTFAKWDEGYKHNIRRKAVIATARAIRSTALREVAAVELAKLGVITGGTPVPPDRHSSATQPHESATGQAPESQRLPVTTKGDQRLEPVTGNLERGTTAADAAPPSMFCSEHPSGTEKSCGPCGTAKLRYRKWAQERLDGEISQKQAMKAARDACDLCDDLGMRLHPDTGKPVARCDHRRSA